MAALPFIAVAAMAAGAVMQGMQSSQNSTAQANAASSNATYDRQLGNLAGDTAAARGGTQLRQGAQNLGTEAAAIGESGSGVASGSSQDVLRQSETNARMDFLNTIYGGKVQKYADTVGAGQQDYMAEIDRRNAQSQMFGGFMNAGTTALTGANDYRMGTGGFGPTTPTL
jgi:hypothetical protein